MPESANVDPDGFSARSALALLLGGSARVMILAALLSEDHRDMDVIQIADLAGVHRTTVYDHLDDLEMLGVVVQTRTVGGSPMYQINRENPIAKDLKQMEDDLLMVIAEREVKADDFEVSPRE